ncbi:hypothetical protein DRO61_12855 [Candidatus Bathyarchaeota archaeon]|nr:MAG: hypothetical protein DRO61_12855 [Candidatus Bathyarchaeota archaeon]
MKTFLICIEYNINDHVGEEYDDILEVEDMPTQMTVASWADRIKGRIRKLWNEDNDIDDDGTKIEDWEKGVEIILDGTPPYHTMLMRLQPLMLKEESIEFTIPYADELDEDVEYDSETEEFLRKRK